MKELRKKVEEFLNRKKKLTEEEMKELKDIQSLR